VKTGTTYLEKSQSSNQRKNTKMKIQIEVDEEIIDKILKAELKWHRDNAKTYDNLSKEDKKYFKKLAPALDIVCEYFGVDKNDTKRN
jgi:hypothetical protein